MIDDLRDRLMAAVDTAAAPVEPAEARLRGKRYTRRRLAAACTILVGFSAAGLAVAFATTWRPSGRTARVTVGGTSGAAGSATSTPPLALSAHLELPTSIVAGSSETGYLVIDNNSGAPLHLTTEGTTGCTPHWSIVLRSSELPQSPALPSDCGPNPLVVSSGETRLRFALVSTYATCSATGQAQGVLTPACLPDAKGQLDVAPPLPAGLYEATFFSDVAQFVPVTPVPIRVEARS